MMSDGKWKEFVAFQKEYDRLNNTSMGIFLSCNGKVARIVVISTKYFENTVREVSVEKIPEAIEGVKEDVRKTAERMQVLLKDFRRCTGESL